MVNKLALMFIAIALLAAACSDSTPVETVILPSTTTVETPSTTGPAVTSDPDQSIVLGSGTVPETLPAEFPLPAEAVIGSTLIDRNRDLTEVVMRVPAGVDAVAAFFATNLVNRGYTVDSSAGDSARWEIALSGRGLSGTVVVTLGSQDVSQAVVRVTADS